MQEDFAEFLHFACYVFINLALEFIERVNETDFFKSVRGRTLKPVGGENLMSGGNLDLSI